MHELLEHWRPVIDEAMAEVLPREVDDDYLAAFFGEPTYAYDADALQAGLADPVWDLLDRGGKRWRAILFVLLVEAFGEDPHEYLSYATIPEILHTGTIIVDDVEDGAELRRGEPALHHVHGQDVALNAGNALYFIPLKLLGRNEAGLDDERQLAAYEMLTYELNRTHLGQGMDIDWHNRRDVDVAEAEYLEMCACKTGCLARIVGRLAAIVTGQSAEVEAAVAEYTERLSVAFQVIDDVLDVEHSLGRAGEFGKAYGNDIREGKTTLLVIHAMREAEPAEAERLAETLASASPDEAAVTAAIELLDRTGSVAYARGVAEELADEAVAALDDLALDGEAGEALRAFPRFMIDRDV
ncbi:MAG: polyprenyl synthetase family protein [Halobacteriales archaeon]|nr:polyprenyl synthetase family protein [Halobacteriales archaeon]